MTTQNLFRGVAAAFAVSLLFGASAARAQQQSPSEFGPYISILQVPASSFVPRCSGIGTSYLGNGYMGLASDSFCASGNHQLMATVTLPGGAEVLFLDVYAQDDEPADDFTAALRAYTGGIVDDGFFTDVVTLTSAGVIGRGYKASALFSHTINNDVAYGGGAQYEILVLFPDSGLDLGFKGFDIWWRRQVSPAPAVAFFNDVPTNHPFFQFIEALRRSGVTGGCQAAPPLFCPDNPVTRGQMAVFLSKALGLAWHDATGLK